MDEERKQLIYLKGLFELIATYPKLPIIPVVDYDVFGEYENMFYMGKWGRAFVDEYLFTKNNEFILKSYCDEDDVFFNCYSAEDYDEMLKLSELERTDAFNNMPWKKAIFVTVDSL